MIIIPILTPSRFSAIVQQACAAGSVSLFPFFSRLAQAAAHPGQRPLPVQRHHRRGGLHPAPQSAALRAAAHRDAGAPHQRPAAQRAAGPRHLPPALLLRQPRGPLPRLHAQDAALQPLRPAAQHGALHPALLLRGRRGHRPGAPARVREPQRQQVRPDLQPEALARAEGRAPRGAAADPRAAGAGAHPGGAEPHRERGGGRLSVAVVGRGGHDAGVRARLRHRGAAGHAAAVAEGDPPAAAQGEELPRGRGGGEGGARRGRGGRGEGVQHLRAAADEADDGAERRGVHAADRVERGGGEPGGEREQRDFVSLYKVNEKVNAKAKAKANVNEIRREKNENKSV